MHRTKITLIFLFLFTLLLGGCGIFKKSSVDKAMTKERKEAQAGAKELRDAEKVHYKSQPKETRKMMKKSKKMAKKLNKSKRLR